MFLKRLFILAFLNGVSAKTLRSLQGQGQGNTPIPLSCLLLIKITKYEDDSEARELECALDDGTGRILPIKNAPQFVQDKFENGEILSAGDVLSSSKAKIANGKVSF